MSVEDNANSSLRTGTVTVKTTTGEIVTKTITVTQKKGLTVSYRGNGNTHGTVPTDQYFAVPGYITLKQPGNMLRSGHLFGGWSDPVGYVRQPGSVYYSTASDGIWIQTAVWNPVTVPSTHPTTPGTPTSTYSSADAAALAWANYMYSTSLYSRHEFGANIYRNSSGQFYLSATNVGSPHSVSYFTVPTGIQRVATVHSHPNSSTFSDQDKTNAISRGVNNYVAAPTTDGGTSSFHLLRYNVSDASIVNVSSVTLRSLTSTVQTNLASFHLNSWITHLPCCSNMQWPTHPWPPS